MSLSREQQALLKDSGYAVKDNEKGAIHVMFIDILITKGKDRILKPVFQQYHKAEWMKMREAIEKHGIKITSHDQYAVIHDPDKEVQTESKQPAKRSAGRKAQNSS